MAFLERGLFAALLFAACVPSVTMGACAPKPPGASNPTHPAPAPAEPAAATHDPLHPARLRDVKCEQVGQRWGAEHEWMLALTWSAGFCAVNPRAAESDECAHPTPWSRANLSLHGLWPQWDSYCVPGDDGGRRSESECRDWISLPAPAIHDPGVQQRLATMMPGLDTHLERHEWAKHGTCSGLTADAYFGLAEALDDQVNQLGLGKLLASANGTLTAGDLCAAVRGTLGEKGASALQIEAKQDDDGQRYLIGVWFALADDSSHPPATLAIDGAHLRVNPNRACGGDEGRTYVVAR
jgi:ribonuclease T2